MHSNITIESVLWFLVAVVGSGMLAFLIKGWIIGLNREREMRMRKRQTHRYN